MITICLVSNSYQDMGDPQSLAQKSLESLALAQKSGERLNEWKLSLCRKLSDNFYKANVLHSDLPNRALSSSNLLIFIWSVLAVQRSNPFFPAFILSF